MLISDKLSPCVNKSKELTWDVAILVLDLECGQRGEDEAERGDHHKQARHDRDHLKIQTFNDFPVDLMFWFRLQQMMILQMNEQMDSKTDRQTDRFTDHTSFQALLLNEMLIAPSGHQLEFSGSFWIPNLLLSWPGAHFRARTIILLAVWCCVRSIGTGMGLAEPRI